MSAFYFDHTKLTPSGAILPFAGATAPEGYAVCDGSSVLKAGTYAALYTAIGDVWGTADGTHFNLPDLRGRFLRGHDDGEGTDPDAAGRTASATGGATGDNVGSVQSDAYLSHNHLPDSGCTAFVGWQGTSKTIDSSAGGALDARPANAAASGGNETRPVNACVNYIIKL